MLFNPVVSFPYGRLESNSKVIKIVFQSVSDSELKLEGFYIEEEGEKYVVIVKDLNNIYDYKTIDTDNVNKFEKITEFGNMLSVEIVNNSVNGYPKILNVNVNIPKEIGQHYDDTYSEYIDKIKDINLALYMHLTINIEANKRVYSLFDVDESYIVGSYLYESIIFDKDFYKYTCFNNQLFEKIMKTIFLERNYVSLTTKNLFNFSKIVKLLIDNNIMIVTIFDFLYLMRITDLPDNMIIAIFKRLSDKDEASFDLEQTEIYPDKKIEDTLLSLSKINKIEVSLNGVVKDIDVLPVYQRDILNIKNNGEKVKTYSFQGVNVISEMNGEYEATNALLCFTFNSEDKTFGIIYNDGENEYDSKIVIDDNFNTTTDLSDLFNGNKMTVRFINKGFITNLTEEYVIEHFVKVYRGETEIELSKTPYNKFKSVGRTGDDQHGYLKATDTDIVYGAGECNFHGMVKIVFDIKTLKSYGAKKISFLGHAYGYYSHDEKVVTDKSSYNLPTTGWYNPPVFNKYEFDLNEINELRIQMIGESYCSHIYFARLRVEA